MTIADRARATGVAVAERRLEIPAYASILALAALLRLGNLAARGTWDADQGHDMLVLRGLVLDGRIPLLGPPTSIGDFHHGVLYYLLLAPAAAISHADPVAVTTWIALGGVAAVAVTGWLARSIAGPVAGVIAALLLAVSSSAVEESIFIWNPNLIALSSSVALASAWRAWQTGRARWWVVAGTAAIVTMQCHVLGVLLTPVIAALLVADHRRRSRAGQSLAARRITRATAAWIGLALLGYVPLAIHELGSDASELRAAVGFVIAGGGGSEVALPARLAIVAVRVLGWPLGGLITAAPLAALLTTAFVVATVAWAGWLDRDARERVAVRWLGLGFVWTVVALAVAAPSLATVVPGLPNDHYHAFADPMVVALVAIGIAGVARSVPRRPLVGASAAGVLVVATVVFNLASQPPLVAADGGWRAAQTAAQRVVDASGGGPVVLSSLPSFKSDEALRFPLESLAPGIVREATDPVRYVGRPPSLVVLCDQLFRDAIGADCGGSAEDARARTLLATSALVAAAADRFEAAPGRWVSVYRLSPGG